MNSTEIKFGGFGGQGVILAGIIVGRAASIYANKFATLTQSFGPEARGSACSAQVILSDTKILYPYVTKPEILLVMSQEAYDKLVGEVKEGGRVFYDSDLVKIKESSKLRQIPIPSTNTAKELGKQMVANVVILGAMVEGTRMLGVDQLKECLKDSVPAGTEQLNLKAFEAGRSLYQKAAQGA